ncbi:MAG: hypothetical protein Ct9H300mP11_09020 [Chloroflexota bacterium]|nr:MAG: hypothetical protein Ct9H300mP11_09020 [Chloroflexota bacterium]
MAIVVVTLAAILVLFVAYKYFLFATFDGEVASSTASLLAGLKHCFHWC